MFKELPMQVDSARLIGNDEISNEYLFRDNNHEEGNQPHFSSLNDDERQEISDKVGQLIKG
jgi:hypothetical protein